MCVHAPAGYAVGSGQEADMFGVQRGRSCRKTYWKRWGLRPHLCPWVSLGGGHFGSKKSTFPARKPCVQPPACLWHGHAYMLYLRNKTKFVKSRTPASPPLKVALRPAASPTQQSVYQTASGKVHRQLSNFGSGGERPCLQRPRRAAQDLARNEKNIENKAGRETIR